MSNQTLPKLRAWVDWDGDGWINKGLATDPRNLAYQPLTLADATVSSLSTLNPVNRVFTPSASGLFKWPVYLSNGGGITVYYVGYNKGSAGSYEKLFTPTATGTYTIQGRIVAGAAVTPPQTFQIQVKNVYPNPANTTNITQTPITITVTSAGQEQFFSYTFTVTNITNMVIGLELFNASGGVGSSSFPAYLKGLSVYSGTQTAEILFNVGTELSKYDNIEDDLVSASWQLGNSNPMDNFPSEGTATLQLDNSTLKFSYEYTGSPFYSIYVGTDVDYPAGHYPYTFPSPKFADGAIIVLEIQDDTSLVWTEVWRGFIDVIDVGTGVAGPIATLSAIQGIFKFDQVHISPDTITLGTGSPLDPKYTPSPSSFFTINKLMDYLLKNYTILPCVPNIAAVNKTVPGDNLLSDVVTPTGTFTLDTGDATLYQSVVQVWGTDTTLATAIRDLMTVDQSLFFINRNGTARYFFRDNIYTNSPSAPADLVWDDLLVNASDYKVTPTEINAVRVDYYPAQETAGIVWSSKAPIQIPAKTTKTIVAKYEYPEGGKINVRNVNAFNAAISPSTVVAKDVNGVTLAKQPCIVKVNSRGTEADLVITNTRSTDVYLTIVLNGTSYVSAGSATVQKQLPGTTGSVGTKEKVVSSKLITTESQADGLASHMLSLLGGRYATFTSVTVSARDAAWLTRILSASLGTRIKFKELAHTGAIYHRVMIVGEAASWTPGTLTMTYTVRPADQYPFLNTNSTYYKLGGVVY